MRRWRRIATVASLILMALAVWGGAHWWNVEAAGYSAHLFRPAPTTAILTGNQLELQIGERPRDRRDGPPPPNIDDYLPDHGKLMHLYAIRWPEMDAAFHLHPELVGKREFRGSLPSMPPGHYRLFGDIVHASGFPETLLATVDIPAGMRGTPLASDDAEALAGPVSGPQLGSSYKLPDGYTMVWDKPNVLTAGTAYGFTFHLLDPAGKPAADMQPYLGMAGHAAFVKTDGSVFAHTHPEGSAAMADVMLANESMGSMPGMPGMQGMPGMPPAEPTTPDVTFPYGFPTAGRYRIFIQMKHGSTVETGVFDADVQ
jgi:hypothetical protein